MKTTVLFYSLMLFTLLNVNSQTQTYQINWTFGVNGASASKTIEEGDTIEWVWADSGFHTVTSKAGSTESFDSGNQNGLGNVFSYTFTSVGTNDYQCDWHPLSMYGTITVVAEGTLGLDDFAIDNFSISPNPSRSSIKLNFPNSVKEASMKIYNVLGKQVYNSNNMDNTEIDVSKWDTGLYIIKVSSLGSTNSKKFVKI
jgi:plastocyanin